MSIPTMTPLREVAPPTRVPLPYGLFAVADMRGQGDGRWQGGGIQWTAITCDPLGGIGGYNCPPADVQGLPKDFGDGGISLGEGTAFTVYGYNLCSPFPGGQTEASTRAMNHLLAGEQTRVEQALWTGDLGNVPNFVGANGYDPPTALSADDILAGMALAEEWISARYGYSGVMHMSRGMATYAVEDGGAEVRNGRLVSALGTPIVAGGGYGTEPGEVPVLVNTIMVSGPLVIYRSDAFTNVGTPYDLLDRSTNDLYAIAERQYVIGVDDCGIAAITVGGTP